MIASTETAPSSAPHVARVVLLRADAEPAVGVGHAMRLLALSQELIGRGTEVHLAGDLSIGWVADAYRAAGVVVHPRPAGPEAMLSLARELEASVCVLDRYDLGPVWGATLRAGGLGVVAMVDGPFSADQDADLYVDQNPGSLPRPVDGGRRAVAGADYTLFRDDVLGLRRVPSAIDGAADATGAPLRVLAVFGGTDPMGAAPVVTPLLLATGCPLDLTVISADDAWAGDVRPHLAPGQHLDVVRPVTDLAARAVASDVVVTASGSSVWELLCLGVPIGVVCVIDNQTPGYAMVTEQGLAAGVGHLEALRTDETARAAAVTALAETFADPALRGERVRRGQALLDGRGRVRVADELARLQSP